MLHKSRRQSCTGSDGAGRRADEPTVPSLAIAAIRPYHHTAIFPAESCCSIIASALLVLGQENTCCTFLGQGVLEGVLKQLHEHSSAFSEFDSQRDEPYGRILEGSTVVISTQQLHFWLEALFEDTSISLNVLHENTGETSQPQVNRNSQSLARQQQFA